MITPISANFEQLYDTVPDERKETYREYWADRNLHDVVEEMPVTERYKNADIAVVSPSRGVDSDETRTIVLPLEFGQSVTPAHAIRAKAMQQLVAPNSRVMIVPNNGFGVNHVNMTDGLSAAAKEKMQDGDYMPYAELLMQTVEAADRVHNFGKLAIIGSSQGALTGLAWGSKDILNVEKILAFETPSMSNRTAKGLGADFRKSGGGATGLWSAIKASEISAQKQAMQIPHKYTKDIAKFVAYSMMNADAKLLSQAMAGSAEYLAAPAAEKLGKGALRFVFIDGSTVFDSTSISDETHKLAPITRIEGTGTYAHATSNHFRLLGAAAHASFNV